MKSKLLNLSLILSSLIGYLEWSGDNHRFLFQAEFEVVTKLFTNPSSAIHPFTILPIIGQILLLITLFQKEQNKGLTYIGITFLGLLLWFMFFVGIISLNYKIVLATIPFTICVILRIILYRNGIKAKTQRPG